jgi:hypothetical protein
MKIATGVIDAGGNFALISLTPVANLPPVSTKLAKLVEKFAPSVLIPVLHLDLQISPRIFFEKIQNDPNGMLWGWGKTES